MVCDVCESGHVCACVLTSSNRGSVQAGDMLRQHVDAFKAPDSGVSCASRNDSRVTDTSHTVGNALGDRCVRERVVAFYASVRVD